MKSVLWSVVALCVFGLSSTLAANCAGGFGQTLQKFAIRPYLVSDLAALAIMQAEQTGLSVEASKAEITTLVSDKGSVSFVALDRETLIGFAVLSFDKDGATLVQFMTSDIDRYIKEGLYSVFARHLSEEAKNRGHTNIACYGPADHAETFKEMFALGFRFEFGPVKSDSDLFNLYLLELD